MGPALGWHTEASNNSQLRAASSVGARVIRGTSQSRDMVDALKKLLQGTECQNVWASCPRRRAENCSAEQSGKGVCRGAIGEPVPSENLVVLPDLLLDPELVDGLQCNSHGLGFRLDLQGLLLGSVLLPLNLAASKKSSSTSKLCFL